MKYKFYVFFTTFDKSYYYDYRETTISQMVKV